MITSKLSRVNMTIDLATARERDDRKNLSYITICNDDLLYLVDHCYNRIGDERIKSIADRLLLSALSKFC